MQDKLSSLIDSIYEIMVLKGTEKPFAGEHDISGKGTYLCRRCGLALYRSNSKFHSGCGWPSFDEAIEIGVKRIPDKDGKRTEIVCSRCDGHLGHVFEGENFTSKNTRHCVNSLSLDFVQNTEVMDTEEAIFAAGCFWGVEHYFKKLPGVLKTEVGYTGGTQKYPTYEEVCRHQTHHIEAIRVVYDPKKINFDKIVQYFFEIHDFTQKDGQGPDIGEQYLSVAFYYDDIQKKTIENIIQVLTEGGFDVATILKPVTPFWPAEDYHQDYYTKTGKLPYCHHYQKIFNES